MKELEKAQERAKTAIDAFEFVQHAAIHDRKFSKDGHGNGHYTTALAELKKVVDHEKSLIERFTASAK